MTFKNINSIVVKSFIVFVGFIISYNVAASDSSSNKYPEKHLNIIVPFSPGGPSDWIFDALNDPLQKELGQTILSVNIGGAGGAIAAKKVFESAPDGYTLLLANMGYATAASLYKNLGFDPEKDLIPIGIVAEVPLVLVGRNNLGPQNLEELKAYLIKNNKKVNIGSAGVGSASHLGQILLEKDLGIKLNEIQYKGTGPALQALQNGEVDIVFSQLSGAAALIKSKSVLPFSITGKVSDFAYLPKYLDVVVWHGLLAPKDTPSVVINKITKALQKVVASTEFKTKVEALYGTPAVTINNNNFKNRIATESKKWAILFETIGLQKTTFFVRGAATSAEPVANK